MGVRGGVTTYFLISGPPHIFRMAEARESCVRSVCSTLDAAFAKLLWPLVVFCVHLYAVDFGVYFLTHQLQLVQCDPSAFRH